MKTINIYIVGTGLICTTLLKQIEESKNIVKKEGIKLKVCALINQKKMLFNMYGINLSRWKDLLALGQQSNLKEYIANIKKQNLQNKIFIDCTASEEITKFYKTILQSKISIVTPNKKANASSMQNYINIRKAAKKAKSFFLYETNVGAGLPVIQVINDLMSTGDEIVKIEGVLSGTLSYIFNNFKANNKFSEVVKEAQKKGYTEPDPRDDLNGLDVGRKLLILAREIGLTLELKDIKIESLVPKVCRNAKSIDDFFKKLAFQDSYFEKLKSDAKDKQSELRYIAQIEPKNRAFICALKMVDASHPFNSLSGSNNIISITTKRYNRPLVIKGPGAGAEVTAAGVLADILKVSRFIVYEK